MEDHMSRSPFGWSYPPGVTQRKIDEQAGTDPSPLEDAILEVLEKSCVPTPLCNAILKIIQDWEWSCQEQEEYGSEDP